MFVISFSAWLIKAACITIWQSGHLAISSCHHHSQSGISLNIFIQVFAHSKIHINLMNYIVPLDEDEPQVQYYFLTYYIVLAERVQSI